MLIVIFKIWLFFIIFLKRLVDFIAAVFVRESLIIIIIGFIIIGGSSLLI